MTIQTAITQLLAVRKQPLQSFLRTLQPKRHRSTIYRLLASETKDIRLSTLISICEALVVSPTELLQLADLWPTTERGTDLMDIRLRKTFSAIQQLPTNVKMLAVDQLETQVETLQRWNSQQYHK